MELPGYTGKTVHMKRELREHIIISEISIDMNRECARFARSNRLSREYFAHSTHPKHKHTLVYLRSF